MRKKIKFDYDKIELMGLFAATYQTMADYFGVSVETIKRRMQDDAKFCASYKKGLANGNMKISEAQFKSAIENRNTTMLIWLGKNRLGQTDKIEHFSTHNFDGQKLKEILLND